MDQRFKSIAQHGVPLLKVSIFWLLCLALGIAFFVLLITISEALIKTKFEFLVPHVTIVILLILGCLVSCIFGSLARLKFGDLASQSLLVFGGTILLISTLSVYEIRTYSELGLGRLMFFSFLSPTAFFAIVGYLWVRSRQGELKDAMFYAAMVIAILFVCLMTLSIPLPFSD